MRSARESANDATLDVESFGRVYLVMSVTPHKDWRVTLDGTQVQPIVTNIGTQGLVVPPGRHHIEMRYRNTLVQHGMIVSAISVCVLLAPRSFDRGTGAS